MFGGRTRRRGGMYVLVALYPGVKSTLFSANRRQTCSTTEVHPFGEVPYDPEV